MALLKGQQMQFYGLGGRKLAAIEFVRTLRIPEKGVYPLPPGLGTFPVKAVDNFAPALPDDWVEKGGVFLPLYQREALWLRFLPGNFPCAIKIGVGKVNAITGKTWSEGLDHETQNYCVVPGQPWLDGINNGDGTVRQFVAVPLGMGYSVEGQVTGKEDVGGLQIEVYELTEEMRRQFEERERARKAHESRTRGLFSFSSTAADEDYFIPSSTGGYMDFDGDDRPRPTTIRRRAQKSVAVRKMGIGAGGTMKQKIYPDMLGVEAWDTSVSDRVFVHMVNSQQYREITGSEPPPSPVTRKEYESRGYPWFDVWDEGKGTVEKSEILDKVKTVGQMDAEHGFTDQQDDTPMGVGKIKVYSPEDMAGAIRTGSW